MQKFLQGILIDEACMTLAIRIVSIWNNNNREYYEYWPMVNYNKSISFERRSELHAVLDLLQLVDTSFLLGAHNHWHNC